MDLIPSFRSVAEVAVNTTPYNFVTGANNSSDILFVGYSPILLNFASAMCIIFMFIGVPGNLITIIALARCKKVRNATAVFIINLSLSDLLFCCFNLPLAASTFWNRAWLHGDLLCRLFPLLRYGLLAVSLSTVLSITINRYVMIGHPRIYPRVYRRKFLGIMVATCWLFAFGALIPTWNGIWGKFGLDRLIGSCTILRDDNYNSPKEFLFIMAFALPCLCIIVCYARIFYIVRKTAMRTHELKPSASVKMTHNPTTSVPQPTNNGQMSTASLNSIVAVPVEVQQPVNDLKPVENGHKLKENRLSFYEDRMHELLGNDAEGQPILADEPGAYKRRRQLFVSKSYRYNNDADGADLRFIDVSVDSDAPPAPPSRKISNNNRYSEEVVAGLQADGTPYFIESNGTPQKQRSEHDSAVDESMSSSENHQTFHHQSPTTEPVVDAIVQLEPSSSSGIELPYDHDHDTPAKTHRYEKKSIVSAIRHSTRRLRKHRSNGTNIVQHRSHANTSGASIMYPGRLSTKDRRLLKMILVIFISFLICYLPITLTKIFDDITELHGVNIAGYLLIYLTTCINPIIYVIMSSEYRQAYKNLMCRTNGRNVEVAGGHKRQGTVKS